MFYSVRLTDNYNEESTEEQVQSCEIGEYDCVQNQKLPV